ncbi:Uncharacterised protein [Sphingobacterium spiritivorum]|uniref:Stationary phase survival protein SurE n=1 Tax=Sphingobacterium spiritivorum TaxID=258 RepID=A0A380C8Y3_SPHSI|nr:hypothetical protein [Sphingobacterium spiritivorum]SUJ15404.1 Uncharacterised protein [Sphingobacterium spiritivorum]
MQKNNFLIGIALGIIAPVIAYLLTTYTSLETMLSTNKPAILYFIAGLVNLVMLRYFYRNDKEQTARGIMLVTFAGTVILIYTLKIFG